MTDHYKAAIEAGAKKNYLLNNGDGWGRTSDDYKEELIAEAAIQAFLAALPNEVDEEVVIKNMANAAQGWESSPISLDESGNQFILRARIEHNTLPYPALLAKVTSTVREKDAEIARLNTELAKLHGILYFATKRATPETRLLIKRALDSATEACHVRL